MNKKNKFTLIGSVFTSLLITLFVVSVNSLPVNGYIRSSVSKGYNIVFNKDQNKFHSTSGSTKVSGNANVFTELGNSVNFTYNNIIGGGATTWHVVSGDNGYFYNSDPINGLESIVLSFKTDSKTYKLYWSETTNFSDSNSQEFTSSTSSETVFDFNNYKPNYFRFSNTSGVNLNIASIKLNYSCASDFSTLAVSSNDSNKGTVSNSSGVYRNGTEITLTASANSPYHFVGWYENGILLSLETTYILNIYYDINCVGVFEGDSHSALLTNVNPTMGNVSGAGIYKTGDNVTISATPNNGYKFVGWYKNSSFVSSSTSYSFIMPNNDVSYEARFEIVTYSISYVLNGGNNDPANPFTYTVEDNDIVLQNPTKTGYSFVKWVDQNGNTVSTIKTGSYGNLILTANWTINYYQVKVASSSESQGTVTGSGLYARGSEVAINATPKEGYDFLGWYDGESKVSSEKEYTFTVTDDISLVGKFTKIYNIYLASEDETYGTVSGPSSCGAGLEVTVVGEGKLISNWQYTVDYWYDEDFNEISHGSSYTFIMPEKDIYLTACFKIDYSKSKIYFGEYPQSLVKDEDTITALDLISTTDSKGYKLYNGEKYLKYSGTSYKDNDLQSVTSGYHYYKVEPIKWRYLTTSDSNVFVTTEYLLDAHRYNEYYSGTKTRTDYSGDTSFVIYANNYQFSEIRTWLNTTFLNQAFDDTSKIATTAVDNSVASTGYSSNPYVCPTTNDKVFLLSYKELTNIDYGYSSDLTRQCKTTEYARARGADYTTYESYLFNGYYWMRSPRYNYWGSARFVSSYGYAVYSDVDDYCCGVRPAMNLNIA